MSVDPDEWWEQLPRRRREQIFQWIDGGRPQIPIVPGQLRMFDEREVDDGAKRDKLDADNIEDHFEQGRVDPRAESRSEGCGE